MRGQVGMRCNGERGATSVEFAVLVSLLAIALIAGAVVYGLQLDHAVASVAVQVQTAGEGGNPGGNSPGGATPGGAAPGGSGTGNEGTEPLAPPPGNSCNNPGNGRPKHCPTPP
jgi:Flp pilus assembly pilin Flp